jgi:hypothetical protein
VLLRGLKPRSERARTLPDTAGYAFIYQRLVGIQSSL